MKYPYKAVVLLSIAIISINSKAAPYDVSNAYLKYDPYGGQDDVNIGGGFGSLEYDFSIGSGYGIDHPTTVTVDIGFPLDVTYTSEIYRPDYSQDCLNGFGCNHFFLDNLTLNDTGNGVIRWDADIQFEDVFYYNINTRNGGWVTLVSIGNGQYQMSPYDYFGDGFQDWSLSAIITIDESMVVPLPPAIWLFGSGFMALLSSMRLRSAPLALISVRLD